MQDPRVKLVGAWVTEGSEGGGNVGYVKMRTAKMALKCNVVWDSLHCVLLIKLKFI